MNDKTYVLLDDVIAHIASCERSDMLPVECSAITLIKNIPAADVKTVVHGKWVDELGLWQGLKSGRCSFCKKKSSYYIPHTFCPNCGAIMDGGKDDV